MTIKDFNPAANPAPRPVPYSLAPPALRARMDALLETIQHTPFDTTMPFKWGREALERLEATAAGAKEPLAPAGLKDLTRRVAAALEDLDVYLGLEGKIIDLYVTRYMPLTRVSDIDVGRYTKEGFEQRFAVLHEFRDKGMALLNALEARLPPEEPAPDQSLTDARQEELKKRRPSLSLKKK